jgi:DNA excision repair protein ERCC-2
VHPEIPPELTLLLERVTTAIADALAGDPASVTESILRLYFDALYFRRMAEAFGSHSLFDVSGAAPGTLCIRNVSPASFLAPRFAVCAAAIVFSATLSPAAYHRRLLGLAKDASWLNVASPFEAGQLTVQVQRHISTRFKDRGHSVRPIVELMARQYREQPGNYLAFFSSFEYLRVVQSAFVLRCPEVPVHEQVQGMRPRDREAFLAGFTAQSRGIGFAVLGGVFAEGIDLPGDRLIGAFIATLGMPQVNPVNAEIQKRLQDLFGEGYEYTYLYPGLQRVVQAAGRVIRSPEDRGCVFLMDDRYAGSRVRELLPAWWRVQCK